jgi:uncharacterized membrane protein YraQ (UPF0718 family)
MIVSARERKEGIEALIQVVPRSQRPTHRHHDHAHDHPHAHEHHHHHGHAHATPGNGPTLELPVVNADNAGSGSKSWRQRLINISETALHDFVDITCFLIIGAFLASVVRVLNVLDLVPNLETPIVAVPVMMLLAILLCLCSEADAFVAANLVQVPAEATAAAIQIPLAGKLAFLVLGPMLDLKLYLMYTRVFRPRLIWTIIPSVLILVFILSLLAHYLDLAARLATT